MLSIVIVHWNTPDLLRNCLASIHRELPSLDAPPEVLVVDCASHAPTHREIIQAFPGFELLEMPENRGYGSACNAGAGATSGDIVLFLNADIELQPGALGEAQRAFDLAPHIGMVAPLLLNVDGSVQSAGYRFPGVANVLCDLLPVPGRLYDSRLNGRYGPGNGLDPYAVDYALGAALAVRREAFEGVGGFDERYGMYSEEIDLARRLQASGWTRLLAPAARITHVGGASTSQLPDAMRAALWHSRGRYHRIWDTGPRQRAIRLAVRLGAAASTSSVQPDKAMNRSIREAFEEGLQCLD